MRTLAPHKIPGLITYWFYMFFVAATAVAAYIGERAASYAHTDKTTFELLAAAFAWAITLLYCWIVSRDVPAPMRYEGALKQYHDHILQTVQWTSKQFLIPEPRVVLTRGPLSLVGLLRPYTLLVPATLSLIRAPTLVEAGVAHELAHARNNDPRLLLLARGLEFAVLVLVSLALVVSAMWFIYATGGAFFKDNYSRSTPLYTKLEWTRLIIENGYSWLLAYLLPAILIAVSFRAAYASLLRRQELLADATASTLGISPALKAALLVEDGRRRPWQYMLAIASEHPSRATRIDNIDNRIVAEQTTVWEMIVPGLVSGVLIAFAVGTEDLGRYFDLGSDSFSIENMLHLESRVFHEAFVQFNIPLILGLLSFLLMIVGPLILFGRDAGRAAIDERLPSVRKTIIAILGFAAFFPIMELVSSIMEGEYDFSLSAITPSLIGIAFAIFEIGPIAWLYQLFLSMRLRGRWAKKVGLGTMATAAIFSYYAWNGVLTCLAVPLAYVLHTERDMYAIDALGGVAIGLGQLIAPLGIWWLIFRPTRTSHIAWEVDGALSDA